MKLIIGNKPFDLTQYKGDAYSRTTNDCWKKNKYCDYLSYHDGHVCSKRVFYSIVTRIPIAIGSLTFIGCREARINNNETNSQ